MPPKRVREENVEEENIEDVTDGDPQSTATATKRFKTVDPKKKEKRVVKKQAKTRRAAKGKALDLSKAPKLEDDHSDSDLSDEELEDEDDEPGSSDSKDDERKIARRVQEDLRRQRDADANEQWGRIRPEKDHKDGKMQFFVPPAHVLEKIGVINRKMKDTLQRAEHFVNHVHYYTNTVIFTRPQTKINYKTFDLKTFNISSTSKGLIIMYTLTAAVAQKKKPSDFCPAEYLAKLFDRSPNLLGNFETGERPAGTAEGGTVTPDKKFLDILDSDAPLLALKILRYAGSAAKKELPDKPSIFIPISELIDTYPLWRTGTDSMHARAVVNSLRASFISGTPQVINAAARLVGRGFTSFHLITSLGRSCTTARAMKFYNSLLMTYTQEVEVFSGLLRWLGEDMSRFLYSFYDTVPTEYASHRYRTITAVCARVLNIPTMNNYGVKFQDITLPYSARILIKELKKEIAPNPQFFHDTNFQEVCSDILKMCTILAEKCSQRCHEGTLATIDALNKAGGARPPNWPDDVITLHDLEGGRANAPPENEEIVKISYGGTSRAGTSSAGTSSAKPSLSMKSIDIALKLPNVQ